MEYMRPKKNEWRDISIRWDALSGNRYKAYYIKTHPGKIMVSFLTTLKKLGISEFPKEKTNLSIRGFLAGPPRWPLIYCSLLFRPSKQPSHHRNPERAVYWFSAYHQLAPSVGKIKLASLRFTFLWQKDCMVWTKSMATSPGHEESGNASSHPNHNRQSAPVMQPPSMQHIQSMAAAMAELTR